MSPRARQPITIAGTEVRAGRQARVDIPTGTLVSGQPISLGVRVLHGKQDGPTVWVSAAIHGDEILGVEVIRRVLQSVDPRQLAGTLLAVPVVNVHGFNTGDRYLPDRRDLNRSFPGSARGSFASQLARAFMHEIVHRSDIGLDLHTGTWGRKNLPQIRADLSDARTLELARVFAPAIIIDANTRDGSLRQAATEAGTTVMLYEGGEALRFDERSIAVAHAGILRVMAHVGMYSADVEGAVEPARSPGSGWVRAGRSGIVHATEPLGAIVEKGQVVAVLRGPFGEKLGQVKSRWHGMVIGIAQDPVVNRGDAVCHIARIVSEEIADAAVANLPINLERGTEHDGGELR